MFFVKILRFLEIFLEIIRDYIVPRPKVVWETHSYRKRGHAAKTGSFVGGAFMRRVYSFRFYRLI